jgi:hypothetical protein
MQNFHKKLTKGNIKSQENSTYIFSNFNMQQLSQKYHKTFKKYVWEFLEFFREFLDTNTCKISQFLTKNGKLLTRKYYIFFYQDLTHKNTKKMSRK